MKHLKRIRKTLFITFFAVQAIFIQAQSDTTYTGNITVTTQTEVDTLNTILAGKTIIDGNLTIGYSDFGDSRSNITDLTPLRNITLITENLRIQQNGQLDNINALNNLQSIGGDFQVRYNDSLTTLGDFPNLQTIGVNFTVFDNADLTTLGDFLILNSIGGGFNVSSNANLVTIGDFPELQSIGEYFRVNGNDLTTLGNFPALQTIGGYFFVNGTYQLTTLGDFPDLQSIGKYFRVTVNFQLTTLGSFPVLQSIGGEFDVQGNDQLTTLGNFPTLTSIGNSDNVLVPSLSEFIDNVSIVVASNPDLVLCSWLEDFFPTGANAVTGDIYINYNATGCETTEEINNRLPVLVAKKHISVHTDSTTTSFNIFANVRWQLATLDNATWITSLSSGSSTHSSRITGENEATITLMHTRAPNETPRSTTLTLTAIDENGNELTNPATITIHFTQLSTFYKGDITLSSQEEVDEFISNTTLIDGNLTIGYTYGSSRSNITNLVPLRNITDITGNLRIEQNGSLDNINALNNLQSIGDDFRVNSNDKLTTLGNFSNLQFIGGYFVVRDHNQLTALGDFPALQTIGGYFSVIGNDTLISLGDFPGLQSIGEFFVVRDHNQLSTLGDFPELQSIGGYFRVIRNDTLTSLGNFPNLTSIGISTFDVYVPSLDEVRDSVSIMVENNSSLSDCCVLANILNQENNRVEGKIFIVNNAAGCDNRNTVQNTTCHTLIVTTNKNHQIAYDSIDPIPITFTVGGSAAGWTSAITYARLPNSSFITLSLTESTSQTDTITIMATPTVNTGVERTATVTLTTTGMGTPDSVSLTITQGAKTTLSTHTKESLFTFYPNPSESVLILQVDQTPSQLVIYNLVGNLMATYEIATKKKVIDVSGLPSGMYLIMLQTDDGKEKMIKRLVKK